MMKLVHQIGPWMLLIAGIFGLLVHSIFYGVLQRWGQRYLDSGLIPRGRLWSIVHGWGERSLKSSRMRWWGIIQSALVVGAGITWFALRP